jgi:hypothetical protein
MVKKNKSTSQNIIFITPGIKNTSEDVKKRILHTHITGIGPHQETHIPKEKNLALEMKNISVIHKYVRLNLPQ